MFQWSRTINTVASEESLNQVEHFVTVFDKKFLPQFLSLASSLEQHISISYNLWAVCLDREAFDYLNLKKYKNIYPLDITTFESKELKALKTTRTNGEYAWTLTPFLPNFIFNIDQAIKRVTYVDSDIYFFKDPLIIIKQFIESNSNYLLTKHDFERNQDSSSAVGRYCVQFMCFNRNAEDFLSWWQEKCTEWCYARVENGKFGDQKYLDFIPKKILNDAYILIDTSLTQGPWNSNKFDPKSAVFFHFHGLRIYKNKYIVRDNARGLNKKTLRFLYKPYLLSLFESLHEINSFLYINQYSHFFKQKQMLKSIFLYIYKKYILRSFKVYKSYEFN